MNVIRFPGTTLVYVVETPDNFAIVLARPGDKHTRWQTAYPRREDAEGEAREGAALCGWRFVGVFDHPRLRALEDWRRSEGGAE